MQVALIGYGSIARDVVAALDGDASGVEFAGALVRTARSGADAPPMPLVHSVDELIALGPDFVVECAGQPAVGQYGERILAAGLSLMVVSVGALRDDELRQRLRDTARRNDCRLLVPAGAVGGIDALAAARFAGIDSVTYRASKPATAWKGSAADERFDLDGLTEATVIFEGNAREAARLFPKNSNVAATIALAGAGFEATRCELVADPVTEENTHTISVRSAAVAFDITLSGRPSPSNPKTSMLTALSVARALSNFGEAIVV